MSDDLTYLESLCETLKAECDALRAELVERNAARNAYASEFPPDHEGKHNVGIILLNIRNLKSECDALRADAERYRWLREESAKSHDIYSNDAIWMVSRQQGGMGQNFFGNKIDAAIDAAREAGK